MKAAWVKCLLLVVLIAGLVLWLRSFFHIDVTRLTPEQIRAFALSCGAWAPASYLLMYAQPLVPLPASVMMMAAGLLFGPWQGLLIALAGATARACSQFAVARLMGREAVAGLLRGRTKLLEQRIAAQGFMTVLLVRLIPNFPSDIQNYGLGFSSVRFWPYALGTLVGFFPWVVVFVYLGHVLTSSRAICIALIVLVLASAGAIALRSRRRRATT